MLGCPPKLKSKLHKRGVAGCIGDDIGEYYRG